MSHLLRRIRKKVFKRWARNAFFPGWRVQLLRWTGVSIGRDVYIADDFMIGDRVSIAPRVTLVTSSHPNNSRIREFAPVDSGPVTIEADAWIGNGAIVLPGVTIGKGAVIGAQSVVAADVPPLTVVAGQPARTVRVLTPPANWS